MLSYEIHGSTLTLCVGGTPPTVQQRQLVFDAIRADAAVPDGAMLLLDVRSMSVGVGEDTVSQRMAMMVTKLGPKLGPVCAILASSATAEKARLFQVAAKGAALRVGIFRDEALAREWLTSCP